MYSLTAKIDFSNLYSISRDELITEEENLWTSYMELFPSIFSCRRDGNIQQNAIRKEFHIQSSPILLFSNQFVPRNWIQVRKVNFSIERVQAFLKKTHRIFQTSLIEFVHRVSSELRVWNSSLKMIWRGISWEESFDKTIFVSLPVSVRNPKVKFQHA